jgi:predicted nucleic acid-binding Zn ribbon protein
MSANMSGLAGLVPAAAALGLVIQSLRNRHERRRTSGAVREKPAVPMPIVPKARGPAATSAAAGSTRHCRSCGTEIPQREDLCAICERKSKSDPARARTTLLHWALFLAMMTAIMGLGYLLAP